MGKPVVFEQFGLGLRADVDPQLAPLGAATEVENLVMDRNTLRVRPGRAVAATLPAGVTAGVRALGAVTTEAGTRVLAVADTAVYASDTAQQFTAPAPTGLTVSAGATPCLAAFKGKAYLADGTQRVQAWDAETGAVDVLDDQLPPATAPSAAADFAFENILGKWTDGSDTGKGHSWNDGKSNWTYQAQFNAEPAGEREDEVDGMTVRLFKNQIGMDGTLLKNGVLGFEMIGDGTGGSHFDGISWMIQNCGTANGTGSVGYNLYDATKLRVRLKVISGNGVPNVSVHFGNKYAKNSLALSLPLDMSSVLPDTWVDLEVDLPTDDSSRAVLSNVVYLAVKIDGNPVSALADRLERSTSIYMHDKSKALTVLVENIATDALAAGNPFMAEGAYDFCASFVYEGDQESPVTAFSAPVTIPDDPYHPTNSIALQVNLNADENGVVVGERPTKIRFYGRGGHIGPIAVLLKEIDVTLDATEFHYGWDGTLPTEMVMLDNYMQRPPQGASLCFPHKGRMLYAGPPVMNGELQYGHPCDTLYLSNWDTPDRVPIQLMLDTPPTAGGWITVGEDGDAITGLGTWGSFCLVFKEQGIWRLEGDTASDLALTPMSATHGCLAHATIHPFADGMTLWLGRDHVWALTTQGVTEIGKPIADLLAAVPVERQRRAFAVVDRQRRWYQLTIPGAEGEDAVTLVLYQTPAGQFGWTRWTGQPGRCALAFDVAEETVILAGDTACLLRLNTGTTDAGTAIPFIWWGTLSTAPAATLRKTVTEIVAYPGEEGTFANLTLRLRAGAQVLARTLAPTNDGEALRWSVPFTTPTTRWQCGVSGTAAAGGELLALAITTEERGYAR